MKKASQYTTNKVEERELIKELLEFVCLNGNDDDINLILKAQKYLFTSTQEKQPFPKELESADFLFDKDRIEATKVYGKCPHNENMVDCDECFNIAKKDYEKQTLLEKQPEREVMDWNETLKEFFKTSTIGDALEFKRYLQQNYTLPKQITEGKEEAIEFAEWIVKEGWVFGQNNHSFGWAKKEDNPKMGRLLTSSIYALF